MLKFQSLCDFYPRPPSALTGIVVGHCVRPSVCPSRTTLPLELFKDFSYQPEIWWDDEQYHGADRFLKWPCSANFCMLHRTLKFSMIGFLTRSEGRRTLPLLLVEDFRYQHQILWGDVQYHGADQFKKWPCSANFCAFHGTLKFSMIGLDQVWGTTLPL